jgi:hypothetical protein
VRAAIRDDEGYLAARIATSACGLLAKTTAPPSPSRIRPTATLAPPPRSPHRHALSLRAHAVRAAIQDDEGYLAARIATSACGNLAETTTTQRGDDASLRTTPLERMAASAADVS